MVSEKFRHQLRQEAEQWRAEGLINAELYRQLAERYQLDSLEMAARNRFIGIFMGLGGILLGLGAIAFVAANWQVWSRDFRVLLLLSVFVGVNAAGFYLWRVAPFPGARGEQNMPSRSGWQQRLGYGLLLLGAILLGANMALMAQMFHIGGSLYELYLVWGLGVLAMAYSLRLTSLGVLAIILVGWGYWLGAFDWNSKQEFSWLQLLVEHAPLVGSLLFIPLAYWCRSRAIFALGAIAVVLSLQVSLGQAASIAPGLLWAIACGLPPALLWGYDDRIFPNLRARMFQPLARNLALWFLSILFYFCSFRWWSDASVQPVDGAVLLSWTPLIDVALLGGFAIWEWLYLARRERKLRARGGWALSTNAIACFIAIATLIPIWHLSIHPIPAIATFLFNVLLFLLAAGLIREGLALGNRLSFWGGMLLLTLQILSRTIEYDTDLVLKACAFFACGIAVIAAGLWFERYSSGLKPSKENSL